MKQVIAIALISIIHSLALAQETKARALHGGKSENSKWNVYHFIWGQGHLSNRPLPKESIDFKDLESWRMMGNYLSISPNGNHFAYNTERCRYMGSVPKADSLVIQSTNGRLRFAFPMSKTGFFSSDSKQYIFQENRRLTFLQLNGHEARCVNDVLYYRVPREFDNKWLAYKLKDGLVVLKDLVNDKEKLFFGVSDFKFVGNNKWFICRNRYDSDNSKTQSLMCYNLETGNEERFLHTSEYVFSQDGKSLLLKTLVTAGEKEAVVLEYLHFAYGLRRIIWSGKNDDSVSINEKCIDISGDQVVFCVQKHNNLSRENSTNCIWYYKRGMNKAVEKVTNETCGVDGLVIQGSPSFTDSGRYIDFFLQPKGAIMKSDTAASPQVEVWNYKDRVLQSSQFNLLSEPKVIRSLISIGTNRVTLLEDRNRKIGVFRGNFAIVGRPYEDRFWEKGIDDVDSCWLFDLNRGTWHVLGCGAAESFWFSPSGNYLVYYDRRKSHYISYDSQSGKQIDISVNIKDRELAHHDAIVRTTNQIPWPNSIAAWLEGDAGLLVFGAYDIWRLDLKGKSSAINITNGFGKLNGIIFSLFDKHRYGDSDLVLKDSGALLMRAFNTKTKYNGFYRKVIGETGDPSPLYMGKYFMTAVPDFETSSSVGDRGIKPVKAKDENIWIVQRQTADDAPNYYKTTDFKTFVRLTDLQPQKKFYWLTQELHSFKHLDGGTGQGVLYKPANFDSSKKYPVLIVFYSQYSNSMFQFPEAGYITNAVGPGNSPIWFLNNGYLVFTPDIFVTPLKYGPEAFNVIEGAAKYLNKLPYVDSGRLGLASHSWSAKLGAYIFTHSNAIAACVISEGFLYGNMLNTAFSANEDGSSKLQSVEEGFQFGSLWDNKDGWLDQTTVLNVNKAKIPLLLLCNKQSIEDYQNQTLQLFTALRRLDKKVWWLKYDKGGHTLKDLNEQKDFTIRYTQYFDHFLKDAPAPRWMTRGVPAAMKGIDMAYELDPSGTCALDKNKDCKICQKWNEQYKRTPQMFTKPISEWNLDADLANQLKTKTDNHESTTHTEK